MVVAGPDGMSEPTAGALAKLTTDCGRAILVLRAQARALATRAVAQARSWARARIDGGGGSGAANQAISTSLVKLTAEGGKVILALR